jgi:3-oxoacyl-(acyl-carrier-protein) synthase
MRPEAIYALIAASIAIKDSRLENVSHERTSLYTGVGQCYSDMWPFIRQGINAATINGKFDLDTFGLVGNSKINPFFSIRTLGALPTAMIAQKYSIRGENYALSSFGAESVELFTRAIEDISQGKTSIAIIGGFQYLHNLIEIENLYYNSFYGGDFYGSSSASFIILEDAKHNQERNGPCYGHIIDSNIVNRAILPNQEINFEYTFFESLFPEQLNSLVNHVIVNPSGTTNNNQREIDAAKTLFSETNVESYFDRFGTLLAGAEPFGTILLALNKPAGGYGISLSRSISGAEGAVIFSSDGAR